MLTGQLEHPGLTPTKRTLSPWIKIKTGRVDLWPWLLIPEGRISKTENELVYFCFAVWFLATWGWESSEIWGGGVIICTPHSSFGSKLKLQLCKFESCNVGSAMKFQLWNAMIVTRISNSRYGNAGAILSAARGLFMEKFCGLFKLELVFSEKSWLGKKKKEAALSARNSACVSLVTAFFRGKWDILPIWNEEIATHLISSNNLNWMFSVDCKGMTAAFLRVGCVNNETHIISAHKEHFHYHIIK